MHIEPQLIDDLKTERQGIQPPLPPVARLVPILFYLAVAGSVLLVSLFSLRLAASTRARDEFRAQAKQSQQQLNELRAERGKIESRAKRASDLQLWTDTARPVQPLVVEIGRSTERGTSISELKLSRPDGSSQHLQLALKLNTTSVAHLDKIVNRLLSLGYRCYSPEQKLAKGEIDYRATLIYQAPTAANDGETLEASR